MGSHLIAYDVAEPGRLRRVARRLEQSAVRVQKSVFVFRGDRAAVKALMADLSGIIDPAADIVQAWPISDGPMATELRAGVALPGPAACVILSPEGVMFLDGGE